MIIKTVKYILHVRYHKSSFQTSLCLEQLSVKYILLSATQGEEKKSHVVDDTIRIPPDQDVYNIFIISRFVNKEIKQ